MKTKQLFAAVVPAAMLFGAITNAGAATTLVTYLSDLSVDDSAQSATTVDLTNKAATVSHVATTSLSQIVLANGYVSFAGGSNLAQKRSRFSGLGTEYVNIGSTAKPAAGDGWLYSNMDANTAGNSFWSNRVGTSMDYLYGAGYGAKTGTPQLHGLEFTLTVGSGYQLSLTKFNFDWNIAINNVAGQTLSAYAGAYYSTNGGTTWNRLFTDKTLQVTGIATNTAYGSGSMVRETISATALTGNVQLRLLFEGSSVAASRAVFLRDLSLEGTVTPIPEPSTYALFGGIAAAGIALAVRRRRKG